MAIDLDERETQIPSKLLTDGSINSENQTINRIGSVTEPAFNWFGSSGSSSSGLSTPRESELGSTETESEDDDFIAELTRQMADYMLQEDDDDENTTTADHGHGPTLAIATARVKKPTTGFYSYQAALTDHNHIQMKNKEFVKQQGSVCWERRGKKTESTQQREPKQLQYVENNNRGRVGGFSNGGRIHPHQAGSGMRVVFLGGSGSRNGSPGTGVFLPRGTGSSLETPKKPRCSTVLIPERVMLALQLHYDDMNALSRSNGRCPALNGDHPQRDIVMGENKGMDAQVQKQHSESRTQPVIDHQEMGLPHEWAY